MISQHDIEKAIISLGFIPVLATKPEKYKVLEFQHKMLKFPVYIKATNRFPLVIHGQYIKERSNLMKDANVVSDATKAKYFNSNMSTFDKEINKGDKPERYGLHFGFKDTSALNEFITQILSLRD